ncbi:MAG: hypothetical protein JXR73_16805 [Candidatus Omnitrophica bacterium]|nr:hypothetical protein [Candidatus Omnitrophota bacterium]
MQDRQSSKEARSVLLWRRWALGFVISILLAWIISQFCSTTLYNWSWDPILEDYVITPGTAHHHCKEGWGKTLVGRHGVYAIPDIQAVQEPKVVFWGDSFVQGFQVDDDEKLAQQFTALQRRGNGQPLIGVGIGTGERDCADYYFLAPRYRDLLDPVFCHIIVLHDIEDALPDRSTTRFRFVSQPEFRLIADEPTPPINNPGLISLARALGMDAFFRLAFEAKTKIQSMRLQPGPVKQSGPPVENSHEENMRFCQQAWDYLLPKLSEQMQTPLVFLYSPAVPTLNQGEIIFSDPDRERFEAFQAACEKHHIGVIDLTPRLKAYFQNGHSFVRGFMNSKPFEGHFNSAGHALAAEAVRRYLENRPHAFHAN